MNKMLLPLLASLVLAPCAAFASDKCNDPIDTWQSQTHLRERLESKDWQVARIKIDDGCYEVKGTDTLGNRFEAMFRPSSLTIRKLEIKFTSQSSSAEDYLDKKPNTYE